ncbi:MAG: hypothetical protein KC591_11500 [Gemmatimonadetes bacterium]|nr:hypothetical protein [Gemmatimonadota bacterium]
MIRRLLLITAALTTLTGSYFAGARADAGKNASRDPNDLMYLPEGEVLKTLSLGHTNLMADLVWFHAIQYYGEQRLSTQNYDQTERLFQVIYTLDPTFVEATRFGALILSQDAGNPEAALRLLERAEHDDPSRWEYPFDRGFIHQTITRDMNAAGDAYRRAASLPDAPDLAIRLAGISFAKLGDRDTAREIWRSILQDSDNDFLSSLAERNLKNLDLDEFEERLTEAVHAYRDRTGTTPTSLAELLAVGILDTVPAEPWGGRWLWVPENDEVLSTTTIDRRMATVRSYFAGLAANYRHKTGEWPDSLGVLVDEGFSENPPWSPCGLTLGWNRRNGDVIWSPPWPPVEDSTQGASEQEAS